MGEALRFQALQVPEVGKDFSSVVGECGSTWPAKSSMVDAALQHGGYVTHLETADLLQRAAGRLSRSYDEDVENERDSRWGGDVETANHLQSVAEATQTLIQECRAAADRLLDDGNSIPLRRAGRPDSFLSSRQAW